MTDVLVVEEITIVAEQAAETVLQEQVERVEILAVAEQGPPGPPGIPGPAGGQALQRIAQETLSALLAVYEMPNTQVALANSASDAHVFALLGITLTAADAGQPVDVQRSGAMDDAGWTWAPGQRVYLGANGALTQQPASAGFDVLIGVALSATRLLLNIQDPIELE